MKEFKDEPLLHRPPWSSLYVIWLEPVMSYRCRVVSYAEPHVLMVIVPASETQNGCSNPGPGGYKPVVSPVWVVPHSI